MMINDETLGEVVAKISFMQWDVIIFSKTKSSHDIIEIDDGVQSHVCFGIGEKDNCNRGRYSDACSTEEMGKEKCCFVRKIQKGYSM